MYDDRLEIVSSGLLPPRITVADLKRDHASHLLYPLIAEPFYRRALIKKWGSGTQKTVETCVSDQPYRSEAIPKAVNGYKVGNRDYSNNLYVRIGLF